MERQITSSSLSDGEPPHATRCEIAFSRVRKKEFRVLSPSQKFISTIEQLSHKINFIDGEKEMLTCVSNMYHMLIPPYYFSLIQNPDDPADPIRMQCVPSPEEIADNPLEKEDPLGEEGTSVTPHLVHRYPNRALLLVTPKCFMYCRHCTRKRLWGQDIKAPTVSEICAALDYVEKTPAIREIIVSGGDPLTLNSGQLELILDRISSIKHVEVIRIGTRTPVVQPDAITKPILDVLKKYSNLWINVQFNHPREITPEATAACQKIQKCGIPMSNQSVLLKGINDTPEVMIELCEKLQHIRIRPYYIFQCDEVVGATHFRTSIYRGLDIIERMRGNTSGMCIPAFVVDGPEGKGKIPIAPNYILSATPEKFVLRNYQNSIIEYRNPPE